MTVWWCIVLLAVCSTICWDSWTFQPNSNEVGTFFLPIEYLWILARILFVFKWFNLILSNWELKKKILLIQKLLGLHCPQNSNLIVEKCQRLIQAHWHAYLLASWVIGYSLMMEVTKRKQKVRTRKVMRNFFFCHHHLIVNSKLLTTIYSQKRPTHIHIRDDCAYNCSF